MDASTRPSSHPSTTAAEYDANFASIVGLEPELIGAVVADGGKNPERLTLVRKARGSEAHKGGSLFTAGDAQDRCLVGWLSGHTDTQTCIDALAAVR